MAVNDITSEECIQWNQVGKGRDMGTPTDEKRQKRVMEEKYRKK